MLTKEEVNILISDLTKIKTALIIEGDLGSANATIEIAKNKLDKIVIDLVEREIK